MRRRWSLKEGKKRIVRCSLPPRKSMRLNTTSRCVATRGIESPEKEKSYTLDIPNLEKGKKFLL
jgi:hypothetical protein